mmetsp:Transcript_5809/g.19204  ORF Transcript_5809/g.19204 Transcript_5809/m.19204 type:complete len:499 (+) Transcript_5809:263-1759(+)
MRARRVIEKPTKWHEVFPSILRRSSNAQVSQRSVRNDVQRRACDEKKRTECDDWRRRVREVRAAPGELRAHQNAIDKVERDSHEHDRYGGVAHASHEGVIHRAVQVVRPPHRNARVRQRARGLGGVMEGENVAAVHERERHDDRRWELLHRPSKSTVHTSAPTIPDQLTVRCADEKQHGKRQHADCDPPKHDIRVSEHVRGTGRKREWNKSSLLALGTLRRIKNIKSTRRAHSFHQDLNSRQHVLFRAPAVAREPSDFPRPREPRVKRFEQIELLSFRPLFIFLKRVAAFHLYFHFRAPTSARLRVRVLRARASCVAQGNNRCLLGEVVPFRIQGGRPCFQANIGNNRVTLRNRGDVAVANAAPLCVPANRFPARGAPLADVASIAAHRARRIVIAAHEKRISQPSPLVRLHYGRAVRPAPNRVQAVPFVFLEHQPFHHRIQDAESLGLGSIPIGAFLFFATEFFEPVQRVVAHQGWILRSPNAIAQSVRVEARAQIR